MSVIELNEVYKPKKKYTVIVKTITFNHSKYIEDTLNGIAMQNTTFPFVNIVLEDNSTDGEQDVIKIWLDRECNMSMAEYYDIPTAILIIVPHKKNINCSFAIYFHKENLFQQKDIRESQVHPWRSNSKYEALCEGDDYWIDPLKLQKQVDFLDANPGYGMCYTKSQRYDQVTCKFGPIFGGETPNTFASIVNENRIPTKTVMFRVTCLSQYFSEIDTTDKGWRMGDYPMYLWFAYNSRIHFIQDCTSVYRCLPVSAAHFKTRNEWIKFRINAFEISRYFTEKYDSSLTHIVNIKLLWYWYELSVFDNNKPNIVMYRKQILKLREHKFSVRQVILILGSYCPKFYVKLFNLMKIIYNKL